MLHLSPERLAALADDLPTAGEAEHIERCAECARERAAHRELLVMARADRDAIAAPLTDWTAIAAGLRASRGLDDDAGAFTGPALVGGGRARRTARGWRWAAQAAAAVVLVAGGVVAGRRSVQPLPASAPAPGPVASGSEGAGAAAPGTLVSNPTTATTSPTNDELVPDYTSVAEARAALTRYEIAYQNAAAYLAQHDSSTRLDSSEGYRTRLAALDRVGRAMREAMREAPYDPVINGYYLTTIGQREATMRQLNTALPSGVRLTSF